MVGAEFANLESAVGNELIVCDPVGYDIDKRAFWARTQEELQMLLGERIALIHRQLGLIYKRARFARSAVA